MQEWKWDFSSHIKHNIYRLSSVALQVLCKQLLLSGLYPMLADMTMKQTQSRIGDKQLTNTSCSKMVAKQRNLNGGKIAMNSVRVVILHRSYTRTPPCDDGDEYWKQG